MFRVEHISYLYGLGALPLLLAALWMLLDWKKKTAVRIGDPALVQQLIGNYSALRFAIKATLVLLAFAVIVLGAANPQKPGKMDNVQRKGVDVMFVLDVSKSMLAQDIKPSGQALSANAPHLRSWGGKDVYPGRKPRCRAYTGDGHCGSPPDGQCGL
jgi:Ca-activated chloride channel family protein